MYYGYGMDYAYLGIIILSIVLGGITQSYINSQYKKWSRVPASMGKTGAQVARAMLDSSGASSVGIGTVDGHLTDYFDPRDNNLHLSSENYEGGSVASVAVACHEAGHAVQTAKGYAFGRFRTALVPVVNFTSRTWAIVLVIGMVLGIAGLTQLAVAFFAFSVLFQLVTLPVEIDASRRAVRYLSTAGGGIDERGARQVLTAAALTYVAAALISVLQLLYLLGRTGDRN
ncbi:zinc metallopeptidase [Olsenella umbonata]|uniref:Zinc metallopeptidase n=1 Tax=Parafannyhessea umbonata TaxID=604330 RepID=A0A7X9Y020_9ACTN|nr:zinc metallopeptidase [Parafannyhessea umbonata]NMF25976.1 zinc metallopeptidase [Parafannyhessea umbonata]